MQRAPLLALVFASACTLPSAPSEQGLGVSRGAIVGGTKDAADPGVVLLIGQKPGSNSASLCSAEVISPHVVLTAAHCVSPDTVGTGVQFQIFLGSNINDQTQLKDSNFLDVKETHFDAAFDMSQLQGGHDIAVAVTTNALPATPLPVNQAALDDSDVGNTLRLVGYGVTSMSTAGQDTSGVKRQVDTALNYVDDKFISFGDSQHNTCEGDSGGPAFMTINGVEVIVGVTSFGDQNCQQGGADTRVDSYWDSFIAPHILSADGALPGATPATSTSPMDGGTSSDPAVTPGQVAGANLAIGKACTDSNQCASGICTLGSQRYCTAACNPEDDNSCAKGTHCGEIDGSPYCVLAQHGCSAGAGAPSGDALPGATLGALLLLGCAYVLRRRVIVGA